MPRNIFSEPAFSPANDPAPRMRASPFQWRDETAIPPRKWLYGRHLLRKFLSLDVAAGGVGKSSLKVGEALAMTTGRELYGKEVHEGPLRVWVYNLEDPAEETERRLVATAKHFDVTPDDVGDRLYVDSGRDQPCVIAEETEAGARILRPVVDEIMRELIERRIDVLILDPFVSSHALSENDNRAMDLVAKEWGRVADVCDCAINLVHHVRKGNGQEATADSARGASALIGAARSVLVYNRMTREEAESAGIQTNQAGFYFRTTNDKANLSPPEAADWHRMTQVELANGDKVGVACPWSWPDPFADVTPAKTKEVQRAIAEGEWRADARASNWVGNSIATVLAMDLEDKRDLSRVKSMLKTWIKNGVLREVDGHDAKRMPRRFVEVGEWLAE